MGFLNSTITSSLIGSLTIENELSEVPRMSNWLRRQLTELGYVTEEQLFRFDLSANEAVTNIISYAFIEPGQRQIQLMLTADAHSIRLQIEDEGIPFNPLDAPPHEPAKSLEEASIGGLGIDFIRHYTDRCEYARKDGRNRLTMINFLSSGQSE